MFMEIQITQEWKSKLENDRNAILNILNFLSKDCSSVLCKWKTKHQDADDGNPTLFQYQMVISIDRRFAMIPIKSLMVMKLMNLTMMKTP